VVSADADSTAEGCTKYFPIETYGR
jgi:hypothetical protein